jgi:zinc and cadmium transporter
MESIFWPLLAAGGIMLISLSGVLFSIAHLRKWLQNTLPYLATFAGGVLVVVVFHLIEETFHDAESFPFAVGAILLGVASMEALHHFLPAHHHHSTAHNHDHTDIDGRRILISDSLHNVGDGILLVASFSVSWITGIVAAVGIAVHEIVQEVSEFFILKEAGFSTVRALQLNFLASATILIGVGISLFLASSEQFLLLFSGLAAGGFLAVILRDILPHALHAARETGYRYHIVAFIAGLLLMVAVQTLAPHEERDSGSGLEHVVTLPVPRI